MAADNPLWMPTKAFLAEGYAPQARHGTVKSLADAMENWFKLSGTKEANPAL